MAQHNAELLQRGYEAFALGDLPTVLGMLSDDITWHVPGRSPLSGDYKGHDGVISFLTKGIDLSRRHLARPSG